MTTIQAITLATALWAAGAALYTRPLMGHHYAHETLMGLRRGDPAAWVALALFLAAWPIIFVGLAAAKFWRP